MKHNERKQQQRKINARIQRAYKKTIKTDLCKGNQRKPFAKATPYKKIKSKLC